MRFPIPTGRSVRFLAVAAVCGFSGCSSSTDPEPNPFPVLSSLDPASVVTGSESATIALSGSGFTRSSIVRIDDSDRVTRFVGPDRLEADLTAADLAEPGTRRVTVFSPPPEGGTSNAFELLARAPVPVLSSISPAVVRAGDPETEIVLLGSGFVGGGSRSRVVLSHFGVVPHDRVRRSGSGELLLTMPADYIASGYRVWVWVENDGPGGGPSERLVFTVENVVPTITSMSPDTAKVGESTVIQLQGVGIDGFSPSNEPVIRWNGHALNTGIRVLDPDGFLVVAIVPAGLVTAPGEAAVTVFNPPPGGGESAPWYVTVVEGGS